MYFDGKEKRLRDIKHVYAKSIEKESAKQICEKITPKYQYVSGREN